MLKTTCFIALFIFSLSTFAQGSPTLFCEGDNVDFIINEAEETLSWLSDSNEEHHLEISYFSSILGDWGSYIVHGEGSIAGLRKASFKVTTQRGSRVSKDDRRILDRLSRLSRKGNKYYWVLTYSNANGPGMTIKNYCFELK